MEEKILAMGDGHITEHRPKSRKDQYFETADRKLHWVADLCETEKIATVLQPGDLFDSWKESDFLKQYMINLLYSWKRKGIDLYTVFGQHDLRYHSSDRLNTPTAILDAAGVITILKENPVEKDGVFMYGCSWGDKIPERVNKSGLHILVIHSMIIESEKLWPQQEEFERGNLLLKKYKFDFIISGDNHKSFSIKGTNRMLINAGSLLRSNVDQINHKPCVWIIDTKTKEAEQILIPIEAGNKVLSFEEHEKQKEENKNLEAFVKAVKSKTKIKGLDFKKNVGVKMETESIRLPVKTIIDEMVEKASGK